MIKVRFNTDIEALAPAWAALQKEVKKTDPYFQEKGLREHIANCNICQKHLTPVNFSQLIAESAEVNLYSAMLWDYYTSRHRGYNSRSCIRFTNEDIPKLLNDEYLEIYRAWICYEPEERPRKIPTREDKMIYYKSPERFYFLSKQ